MTGETGMLEVERLYLMTLAKAAEAAGYASVLQQLETNTGRLWLVPDSGTTQPHGCLSFKFERDAVQLGIEFRDGRTPAIGKTISYAEGLDTFGKEFQRALSANRLAAPRKKAA
jgi:hypothetical protein